MSFSRVIQLLSANKIVTIQHTSYALIENRFFWVKFEDDQMFLLNHDPVININEFAMFCDGFNEHAEGAVVDAPVERKIIGPDGDYDFTKMPKKHACFHCLQMITIETAVLERKWAHCPHCGTAFYRATRLDGVREDGLVFLEPGQFRIRPQTTPPKSVTPKPEKPKELTVEEIMASGKLKPMVRKINVRFNVVEL